MYEIAGTVRTDETGYAVTVSAPGSGTRTLLAFTENAVGRPVTVKANGPSSLVFPTNGADLVIISHGDFREALQPLIRLRQSQRLSVVFVDVEDLYDEFSFGSKDPG
ncbi:MAG: C25 family cysteine peptidase [Desulfobacterales bacterium]|nr:C25 family cysteine peptidase [Desulfobacterales bacterium]